MWTLGILDGAAFAKSKSDAAEPRSSKSDTSQPRSKKSDVSQALPGDAIAAAAIAKPRSKKSDASQESTAGTTGTPGTAELRVKKSHTSEPPPKKSDASQASPGDAIAAAAIAQPRSKKEDAAVVTSLAADEITSAPVISLTPKAAGLATTADAAVIPDPISRLAFTETFSGALALASPVTSVDQCNNVGSSGGDTITCTVTITNTFTYNAADPSNPTGLAEIVTVISCTGSALCPTGGTTTSTSPVTVVTQCNKAGLGGASTVTCTVTVVNNLTGYPLGAAVDSTVIQCKNPGTVTTLTCTATPAGNQRIGDGGPGGQSVTQCNQSGGQGGTMTCTVTAPTSQDTGLPIKIRQCEASGTLGASTVTCTATISNNFFASIPPLPGGGGGGGGTTPPPGSTPPGSTPPGSTPPGSTPPGSTPPGTGGGTDPGTGGGTPKGTGGGTSPDKSGSTPKGTGGGNRPGDDSGRTILRIARAPISRSQISGALITGAAARVGGSITAGRALRTATKAPSARLSANTVVTGTTVRTAAGGVSAGGRALPRTGSTLPIVPTLAFGVGLIIVGLFLRVRGLPATKARMSTGPNQTM